jgi:DNA-binding NarL/FixJ family response regulator
MPVKYALTARKLGRVIVCPLELAVVRFTFEGESTSMNERVPVFVSARDPVSQAGIASQLRGRADIQVVEERHEDAGTVGMVVTDEVDQDALQTIRALRSGGCPRVVIVVARLDDGGLLAAVEAGACGIVRRTSASSEALASAVRAAASGDGSLPPDLLGRLLEQVGRLQQHVLAPRGLSFSGLTNREVEVLKLIADGMDTGEVAEQLFFSERTVKNVIHDITMRLNLRNRTHAVAYAVRQGLI